MNATVVELAGFPGSGVPALLLDATVKGIALLALAALASVLLRRASASARHLAWALAFAGLLLLPALSLLLPAWSVPVVPAEWMRVQVSTDAGTPEAAAEAAPAAALAALLAAAPLDGAAPVDASSSGPSDSPSTDVASASFDWSLAALMVWLAGAALVLSRLVAGFARVNAAARRARRIERGRVAEVAARVVSRLGVRRPVALLEGEMDAMPLTWGVFRPRVLLPAGSSEWPAARLEAVLLHEMAHVRRMDCLTQVASEVVCALYWFNPLVWAAARRLRLEGEHACDDHVLSAGSPATDYADLLLHVARSLRRPRAASLAAVAMARPTQLRTRLVAVLGERRRSPVSRRAAAAALAGAAAVVVPLAAVSPVLAVTVESPAPLAALPRCDMTAPGPKAENDVTDGRNWNVRWAAAGCGGQARIEGKVDFDAAFTDVAAIERGGSLTLEMWSGGERRRVVFRPARGGVERTLWVDGRERPWDASARAWLADALPELLRHTVYASKERATRVLETGGPGALADEAARMGGENRVRALEVLVASGHADGATLLRVLREAAGIRGGADRASLLVRIAPAVGNDATLRAAYLDAAQSIPGGTERRRALAALPAVESADEAPSTEDAAAGDTSATTELNHTASDESPPRYSTLRARNAVVAGNRSRIESIRPGGYVVITERQGGRYRSVRVFPGRDGRLLATFDGDFGDRRSWLVSRLHEFAGPPGRAVRW